MQRGIASVSTVFVLAFAGLVSLVQPSDAQRPRPSEYRGEEMPSQIIPGLAFVGVRATVTGLRPLVREADLDFTAFTSYTTATPSVFLGAYSYPAIDYGDGSTVPTTTLALASPGGGPFGTNVYRASFTHTYPAFGFYTVRVASLCYLCYRSGNVAFPAGSPPPPTFTFTFSYVPSLVTGSLAGTYAFTSTFATTSTTPPTLSVRGFGTFYSAITDTQRLRIGGVTDIPAASEWGLAALATALLVAGLWLLRRTP